MLYEQLQIMLRILIKGVFEGAYVYEDAKCGLSSQKIHH